MMIDILMTMNLFMMSLLSFIFLFKYMLMILMAMELMIMSIFIFLVLMLNFKEIEILSIYYLIFSVCESVLGMIILILVIRFYGNELLYLMNLKKFI
nr:NADH dehydrogenase subunit 4L [Brachyponera chinensis]